MAIFSRHKISINKGKTNSVRLYLGKTLGATNRVINNWQFNFLKICLKNVYLKIIYISSFSFICLKGIKHNLYIKL